ncbi:MAG: GntR family transcriptional regulator [Bryobacteraceae bacterium]|nr:GntR family transcriptional regulator [Bryobacteraceae bacterium]MDW8376534.1 GntR family transcriptional regulator [Bryobacterales bacterium]
MSLLKKRLPAEVDLPLHTQAYLQIRDAILAGKLPPGAPISRRSLAEQLKMSTLPVSDALLRLESEGLVESRPRAGTRVKIPTVSEINGNYVVREALETHSARLFAELASVRDRKRLLKMSRDLDRCYLLLGRTTTPDADKHSAAEKLHLEFHMLVAEATGCKELAAAIERSRVLLFNWLFMTTGDYIPLPPRWHGELAEVLVNGTPDEAAEKMRVHVRYRKDAVLAKFESLHAADQQLSKAIARGPQRARRQSALLILRRD